MGLFSPIVPLLPRHPDGTVSFLPFAPIETAPVVQIHVAPPPSLAWHQTPKRRATGVQIFRNLLFTSLGSTAGDITSICRGLR